jgi:hypothetical protein
MNTKWVRNLCPYAKDQRFDSVIGDVVPGEIVFGFSHTQVAGQDTIIFSTATSNKVTQMVNTDYKVQVTKVSSGSEVSVPFAYTQYETSFILDAEAAEDYDIIVIGKVRY